MPKKGRRVCANWLEMDIINRLSKVGVARVELGDRKKCEYERWRFNSIMRQSENKGVVGTSIEGNSIIFYAYSLYRTLTPEMRALAYKEENTIEHSAWGTISKGVSLTSGDKAQASSKTIKNMVLDSITRVKKERENGVKPPLTKERYEMLCGIMKENLASGITTQEEYDEKMKELKDRVISNVHPMDTSKSNQDEA